MSEESLLLQVYLAKDLSNQKSDKKVEAINKTTQRHKLDKKCLV